MEYVFKEYICTRGVQSVLMEVGIMTLEEYSVGNTPGVLDDCLRMSTSAPRRQCHYSAVIREPIHRKEPQSGAFQGEAESGRRWRILRMVTVFMIDRFQYV